MNAATQLSKLYKYDYWANSKIADVLQADSFTGLEKCTYYFAHIRASHQVWDRRIRQQSFDDIPLWPEDSSVEQDIAELKNINRKWLQLLKDESKTLDRDIIYKNSKGTEFHTLLADILHHLVIHGQHHRAQIATLIRKGGQTPPTTDFIFYLREQ